MVCTPSQPIIVPEEHSGRFCVAFDPLDGSSNIDCNVSTGTIFAVYERVTDGPVGKVEDILRTGNDIVAAGYCMYGAATELVMCFKQGKVKRPSTPTLNPTLTLGRRLSEPTLTLTLWILAAVLSV